MLSSVTLATMEWRKFLKIQRAEAGAGLVTVKISRDIYYWATDFQIQMMKQLSWR